MSQSDAEFLTGIVEDYERTFAPRSSIARLRKIAVRLAADDGAVALLERVALEKGFDLSIYGRIYERTRNEVYLDLEDPYTDEVMREFSGQTLRACLAELRKAYP